MDFSTALDPQTLLAFATLLLLEVVLGIDNVIFISILAGSSRRSSARRPASSASASPWGCASCCC
jgi:predicted tellurium resistance membrane protein TerC